MMRDPAWGVRTGLFYSVTDRCLTLKLLRLLACLMTVIRSASSSSHLRGDTNWRSQWEVPAFSQGALRGTFLLLKTSVFWRGWKMLQVLEEGLLGRGLNYPVSLKRMSQFSLAYSLWLARASSSLSLASSWFSLQIYNSSWPILACRRYPFECSCYRWATLSSSSLTLVAYFFSFACHSSASLTCYSAFQRKESESIKIAWVALSLWGSLSVWTPIYSFSVFSCLVSLAEEQFDLESTGSLLYISRIQSRLSSCSFVGGSAFSRRFESQVAWVASVWTAVSYFLALRGEGRAVLRWFLGPGLWDPLPRLHCTLQSMNFLLSLICSIYLWWWSRTCEALRCYICCWYSEATCFSRMRVDPSLVYIFLPKSSRKLQISDEYLILSSYSLYLSAISWLFRCQRAFCLNYLSDMVYSRCFRERDSSLNFCSDIFSTQACLDSYLYSYQDFPFQNISWESFYSILSACSDSLFYRLLMVCCFCSIFCRLAKLAASISVSSRFQNYWSTRVTLLKRTSLWGSWQSEKMSDTVMEVLGRTFEEPIMLLTLLQSSMIKLSREAQIRHDRMLQLQEEQELLRSQLDYARKQNQKMVGELAQREERRERQTHKNAALKEELLQLNRDREVLREKVDNASEKDKDVQERQVNLTMSKQKIQIQIQHLRSQIKLNQEHLSSLKLSVQKKDEQYQKSEVKIIEYRQKIEESKQSIGTIEKQIEAVQRDIAKVGALLD